ncbi:hypothetical protein OIN60_21410 [Paenibacillus sp. P96]|uniref:Uncharacterized protein n=1 Tax=Paenibacillus zeirhizosphaerae TaxID=2987519 RepID=A0ABT9FX25_9BACL|nr:hypothetical protein [Paenibacillus sp. P96]MDP4099277.1 hypothetical protein [Paenibacillus sp. P96]
MFVTITDFTTGWLEESANTERVLAHLTDASLAHRQQRSNADGC